MKKLLGVLLVATTLVASTFALDLSIGGRGLIGGNIGNVAEVAQNKGEGLVAGGGLYVNVGLFGGLGVQGEVNFLNSQIAVKKNGEGETVGYTTTSCNIVDVPILAWYNFQLSKFAIGAGIGVNFSALLPDNTNVFQAASDKDKWNAGLAVGANVKFYFNDHFGLVIGANGVFDFIETSVVVNGGATDYLFNKDDGKRKAIYGTIGAEFKLF